MKTVRETKTNTNESEVKKELKECLALWKTKAKTGLDYLTGKTSDKESSKLVAYYNSNKKNPNEPDVRVYAKIEGEKDMEVASLWENVGKTEKRYFTGKTNDDEKLVGFYNEFKTDDGKQPDIKVYYKED